MDLSKIFRELFGIPPSDICPDCGLCLCMVCKRNNAQECGCCVCHKQSCGACEIHRQRCGHCKCKRLDCGHCKICTTGQLSCGHCPCQRMSGCSHCRTCDGCHACGGCKTCVNHGSQCTRYDTHLRYIQRYGKNGCASCGRTTHMNCGHCECEVAQCGHCSLCYHCSDCGSCSRCKGSCWYGHCKCHGDPCSICEDDDWRKRQNDD